MANGAERKPAGSAGLCAGIFLRLLAVAATLVAAVVMATAKQTKMVRVQVVPTLPPLSVPATAKPTYSSSFVYLMVGNAIACAYAVCSLAAAMTTKRWGLAPAAAVSVLDGCMAALLFSCTGAGAAFGQIAFRGNSHTGWSEVCSVFGRFCAQALASVVVSLVASLSFLLLLLLSVISLHRRSSSSYLTNQSII